MSYRDVFVAVGAFKVFAYVRLLTVFCSTFKPVPSVSILGTREEIPRNLSRPSAKGGEGAAVAQRRRPFSRLDRPFGLQTSFWSLGFLRRSRWSTREFGVEIFGKWLRNGVRDLGGFPLFSPRGRLDFCRGRAESPLLRYSDVEPLSIDNLSAKNFLEA